MMQSGVEIHIVVALISISWSVGLFVGLFTAKFVSKKECVEKSNLIHARIDSINNCLSGGKLYFELRQVKAAEVNT